MHHRKNGAGFLPPHPSGKREAGYVTAQLSRVHLGNATLVNPKIGRDVMLEFPLAEAIPDKTDYFIRQARSCAPLFASHSYSFLGWRDLGLDGRTPRMSSMRLVGFLQPRVPEQVLRGYPDPNPRRW